jgi:hypothetical protein
MNPLLVSAIAGPVISGAVSLLKRFKLIDKYPKSTAFVASVGVAALQTGLSYHGVDVGTIAAQILIPFAGSVTTYEAVTTPIKNNIVTP